MRIRCKDEGVDLLWHAMEDGPDYHDWFFYYSEDAGEQERLIERAEQHQVDTRALCVTASVHMLADVVSIVSKEVDSGDGRFRFIPLVKNLRPNLTWSDEDEVHLIIVSIL